MGALVVYAVLGLCTAVSDDEPAFADAARSASLGRGFAAPVLGGMLPGAEQRLMWQPPGYFVLLAGWFRLVGFGLLQGRLLSALGVAVALAVTFTLARRVAPTGWVVAAVVIAAAAPWVFRAGTTIRPEGWTLAAFAGTVAATLAWQERGGAWRAVAVVGCAAIAMLMHPIGAMAVVFVAAYLALRRNWLAAVGLPVATVVVVAGVWAVYVVDLWPLFVEQMRLQGLRKSATDPLALVRSQDALRLAGYVPLAVTVVVLVARRRPWRPLIAAVVAVVVAALSATVGGEEQYPAYLILAAVPLVAVALIRLAEWRSSGLAVAGAAVCTAAVMAPAVVAVTAEAGAQRRDAAVAAAVGERPVFIGPGAAGLYFTVADPAVARTYSPVLPVNSSITARVMQGRVLVMRAGHIPARSFGDLAAPNRPPTWSNSRLNLWAPLPGSG